MKLDINDPRLLDYVLGELDAEETKTIESALEDAENNEARQYVAEMGVVAEQSRRVLGAEATETLGDNRREAVMSEAGGATNVTPMRTKPVWMEPLLAVGAVAALACFVAFPLFFGPQGRESMRRETLAERQERDRTRSYQLPLMKPEGLDDEEASLAFRAQENDAIAISADEVGRLGGAPVVSAPQAPARASSAPKDAKEAASAEPTGNLQNVGVGDSVKIRANWYADSTATAPSPAEKRGRRLEAEEAQVSPETLEQMEALGYLGVSSNEPLPAVRPQQRADLQAGSTLSAPPAPAPAPAAATPPPPPKESANKDEWFEDGTRNLPRTSLAFRPLDRDGYGGEAYAPIQENAFLPVGQNPLSTFSVDVDTASYSNVRRFIENGQLPPPNAVRLEELVNYFAYDYTPPVDGAPFSVAVETAGCPWAPDHRLAKIGVKGKVIEAAERPAANIVFLIDVSGSMSAPNKLPLVQESLKALVRQMDERDNVGIVTYASGSQIVLQSTNGENKGAIEAAINGLSSGGSTHGSAGIQDAYNMARQHFIPGGINRVVLATDGDFNVGIVNPNALVDLIQKEAKSNVFLTALGFGMGNIKDATLEQLADKGNGNYAYIDDFAEARRELVDKMTGTLVTIAKDVKIQVEFNPAHVQAYRLLGYENRALAAEDFNDDTKDAGEIGAGHTVTALYEIVPVGAQVNANIDDLKYQTTPASPPAEDTAGSPEMMTVKLRYKQPEGDTSAKIDYPVIDNGVAFEQAGEDFRFAASVAAYGMILRNSQYKGTATLDDVMNWAGASEKGIPERREFQNLVVTTKTLQGQYQR